MKRELNDTQIRFNPTKDTRDYHITEINANNIFRHPIRLNGQQFAFCLSGHIKLKVSGEEFTYTEGSIASFSPFNMLETLEASSDFSCTMLMFQKSFLTETLNNIYFLERFQLLRNTGVAQIKLNKVQMQLVFEQLKQIRKIYKQKKHPFQKGILRSHIIILLYEIEHILSQTTRTHIYSTKHIGKEKKLADFHDLLLKHFYKERKVSFYADALSITSIQLSKLLQETTGRTTKEHIDTMRLLQAKYLLNSGSYNIAEVASLLYYENTEEFSRFFKKKAGISPLRFAKGQSVSEPDKTY